MSQETPKNTYVTLHKNFVRTDIEYADRRTGEVKTFNSVTLPKGTVIDGRDVSYYQFSPLFVNESRYRGEDYRDIPLLTEREVWLRKSILDEDGKPVEVTTIVISTQHAAEIEDMGKIKDDLIEHVIAPVMAAESMPWDNADIYVNPTGRFVVGGPMGDTGLTGRKIIVDTYGGYGRHGGGAFSGKDCTKVDRSAAYAARWVAKNVVAAGLANRCEVELAYAIGVSKPLSIMVDTFGTAHVAEDKIVEAVEKTFDLRPGAIIRDLDLRRPIYEKTAAYGHFGREDPDFTWEKTDRVKELKAACGL